MLIGSGAPIRSLCASRSAGSACRCQVILPLLSIEARLSPLLVRWRWLRHSGAWIHSVLCARLMFF